MVAALRLWALPDLSAALSDDGNSRAYDLQLDAASQADPLHDTAREEKREADEKDRSQLPAVGAEYSQERPAEEGGNGAPDPEQERLERLVAGNVPVTRKA